MDRRMVACVCNPVAAWMMCSTPIRLRIENDASGSTSIRTSISLSGRLSPRARPVERKFGHALGLDGFSILFYDRNNLFTRHGPIGSIIRPI
jgi:hypothetical protein